LEKAVEGEWDRAIRVVEKAKMVLRNHSNSHLGQKLLIYKSIHTVGKYNLHFNIISPDWRGHYVQYFELIDHLLQVGIAVSITSTDTFFSKNQNRFRWCTSNDTIFQNCVWMINIGFADNINITRYNEPFLQGSNFYEKYRPNLILFDQLLYAGKSICAKYGIPGVSIATNPFSIVDPHAASENLFSLRTNMSYNQSLRDQFIRRNYENLEYFADKMNTNSFPTSLSTWLEWRCYPISFAIDGSSINTLATSPLRSYYPKQSDSVSEDLKKFLKMNQNKSKVFVAAGSWSHFPNINFILQQLILRNYSVIFSSSKNFECQDEWCQDKIYTSTLYISNSSEINQIALLAHPINLFFSHCGYNSLMESIEALVPLICLPIHSDQPGNARRVEEEEIGIYLRSSSNTDLIVALDRFLQNQKKYQKNLIRVRNYVHETTMPLTEVTKLLVKVAHYGVKLISNSIVSDFAIDKPN
jgi:hypothetical protein